MRVLMTTDTVGGVWTYTHELVEGLAARGHAVTLVSMGAPPTRDQEAWTRAMREKYPSLFRFQPTDWKLEWMPDGHASFEDSCASLLRLVEQEQPDLLHSNQLGYGALPVEIPKLVVAHSDVVSWWHARHSQNPPSTPWMTRYREIVQAGLLCADAVVAPTAWMRDRAIEHYAAPRSRCSVIPNGRKWPPAAARKKMQAVTAGRLWDEGKNIRILEHVHPAMPIYVAGEQSAPGEAAASETDSPRDISFLGRLQENALQQLLAESAVYVATSLYEPFGLAPLEAALAGCALVANDIPSLHEVWGDAALYYSRNQPDDLSSVLSRLRQYPAEAEAAGARARERAQRLYTADTMVDRYAALYTALIERTAASVA